MTVIQQAQQVVTRLSVAHERDICVYAKPTPEGLLASLAWSYETTHIAFSQATRTYTYINNGVAAVLLQRGAQAQSSMVWDYFKTWREV